MSIEEEEVDPAFTTKYTETGWIELDEDGKPVDGSSLPEPIVPSP